MFDGKMGFCINSTNVAAKVIDGEAILINLDTGAYYSMDNVGSRIWSLIESQRSVDDIVGSVAAEYEVSRETVHADVQRVIAELIAEDLIIELDDASAKGQGGDEATGPTGQDYQAPMLNAYHDMSALLALDPPPPLLQDLPTKTG